MPDTRCSPTPGADSDSRDGRHHHAAQAVATSAVAALLRAARAFSRAFAFLRAAGVFAFARSRCVLMMVAVTLPRALFAVMQAALGAAGAADAGAAGGGGGAGAAKATDSGIGGSPTSGIQSK